MKFFSTKLTDDQIKDVDLGTYQGVKREVYKDGKLIAAIDTRNIFAEKAKKLQDLQQRAEEKFSELAPLHDQLNQLAGRLTDKESTKLDSVITALRTRYQQTKQQILNATTLDELEQINIGD